MAVLTPGEKRASGILRAKKAIKLGWSQSKFIADLRARGETYRRTDMLATYRTAGQLERKADAYKYVRKDRAPTAAVIAQVDWTMSKEYMYKVKVASRTRPGEPLTERFVNIMQDRPMTPGEIEALTWEMIAEQSPKIAGQVESVTPFTAIRGVM